MKNQLNNVVELGIKNQADVKGVLEDLMTVARPDTVYSQPITAGDYTIITASEVSVGAGLGYGLGGGTDAKPTKEQTTSETESSKDENQPGGFGGAGGGGGGAMGRPVAVISIGPNGVQVTPVIDATKIGLAFLTALAGFLVAFWKIRRASR